MERISTKALVEGAIFSAITALLGIMYFYMNFVTIFALVWPVPIIIIGYRNGIKISAISALSAALIVSLVTHPLIGAGLFIGFGLPGILMGYMIKKGVNPHMTVLVCGLVLSFTTLAETYLSMLAAGLDLAKQIGVFTDSLNKSAEIAMNLYRQMGMAEDKLKLIGDYFKQLTELLSLVLPSAVIMSGFIFSFVDFKLTRIVLGRIGYKLDDIKPFSKWRVKRPHSTILLFAAIAAWGVSYYRLPGVQAIAANVSLLLMMTLTILGISVLVYYAGEYGKKHEIPKPVRVLLVVLAVLLFGQLLAALAVADMVFDIRKLESENPGGV